MFGKKLWVLVSMMMLVAGCGGAAAPKGADFAGGSRTAAAPPQQQGFSGGGGSATSVGDSAPTTASAPPPATAPAPADFGGARPSAATKSAESSRGADARNFEPAPERRPGLGTEWGESRTSRVHDVSFVRDSSRPFALASLNYNDRRGVEALAAREANRDTFRSIETGGGAVSVSIRDDGGNPLEAMRVGAKTFVIGAAGQRYSIVLTNHTSHRFEAVATVDGLDVINGKDGSFDNRGYVLLPFATLEIDGFRQSSQSVAAFRFASVADSYAAQMGKARNVGVIGVAFFAERGDAFVPESELRTRETASPFPADPRFAPAPPRR